MRVALFTGAYNHIEDGVSLTLNRLVAYLEKKGVAVRVFAPTISDPPISHQGTLIPIASVPMPGRKEYRIAYGLTRRARRELQELRPTIVHIATPDFLGRAALLYARAHGIDAVSSYHTHFSSYMKYYDLDFVNKYMWRYLKWFYGNCRQVYVPSPSIAEVLRSHEITEGLLYWPRGVDRERFHPRRRSMEWRRRHGIRDEDVVVSFVSRLVAEKGLDVVEEVGKRLRSCACGHRMLIVGDGPARSNLERQLPEAIFTGHLGGSELATAYASSDVFLFPSETETFGNVTLEAMASGVPAVCADATGSNALVEHGETGYLARPNDAADFEEHVRLLIEDASLRGRMSLASRERSTEYEWDSVLERMYRYYQMLSAPQDKTLVVSGTVPPLRRRPLDSAVAG